jgi:hypothetical protein
MRRLLAWSWFEYCRGICCAPFQDSPAAILWPDKERQWEAIAPLLRDVLPQFLVLGDYEPTTRQGPAIWLKCMIARTLPEADWPEDAVPVIYLPGVSRQELRAGAPAQNPSSRWPSFSTEVCSGVNITAGTGPYSLSSSPAKAA